MMSLIDKFLRLFRLDKQSRLRYKEAHQKFLDANERLEELDRTLDEYIKDSESRRKQFEAEVVSSNGRSHGTGGPTIKSSHA
jgi:hypothetical protein